MQYRIFPAVTAPALLALVGLSGSPALHAQSLSASRPIPAATRLETLSKERAARWAAARSVIHCSPAPLTEQPGSAAALARPHVAPLEEAFLDAAIVRRTFAAGSEPLRRRAR
jgi:hypothetical protein